jgi:prepilin-type N-terminal cleavage/methylation domain-containing protein
LFSYSLYPLLLSYGDRAMTRQIVRPNHGYSLLEVLLTVTLLGLLLLAVGNSVSRVLDSTMLGEGRHNVSRTADELASRLTEEGRSSTAVYVPSFDVLGLPNTGPTGGHEIDFFRKASDGTATFVAYRFDQQSGSIDRYEYVPRSPNPPQIIHQDQMAEHIASFAAVRTAPGSIGGIVGGGNINPVNIYYGSPEIVGGNAIVTVSVTSGVAGEPQRSVDIHLASRAAPTDVSILVNSGSPPPSPSPSSSPVVVGFALQPNNFHPPHGPNHGGDPGGGGVHGPGIPGTATFIGNGVGPTVDWLSLYAAFNTVTEGVYSFKNADGQTVTVSIACDSGCPLFIPKPIQTTGPIVVFHTTQ